MLPSIGSFAIGKLGGRLRHAERTARSGWLPRLLLGLVWQGRQPYRPLLGTWFWTPLRRRTWTTEVAGLGVVRTRPRWLAW